MRVVGGQLGGRRLVAPPGRTTRPTSDRVREAVFSMLGDLHALRVLDLFAGSGALGIESLSRGARAATFVERDARAAATIRRNLEVLDLGVRATVHRRDALGYVRGASATFDLIFVDPPYSSAPAVARPLAERLPTIASAQALIVTESHKRTPLELELPLARERVHGDTRIAVHRVR